MIEPRYFQKEAVDSLYEYFRYSDGNPVIAMPTGTGKSVVIGCFVRGALMAYPSTRILMLTHVKTLVAQNSARLQELWPVAPLGIYSAGLNSRDTVQPIIFGSVQSVVRSALLDSWFDLVIIDEAHLLSPKADTMYQTVLDRLRAVNKHVKVIGLTATPYRLGTGKLTDGGIFTDICYDITQMDAFNRLIAEGYLAKPVPRQTDTIIDTGGIGLQNGDFAQGQLAEAADRQDVNYSATREMVYHGHNRRSWLVFGTGIPHCEHLAETLRYAGIDAAAIHSQLPAGEADRRIAAWKRGELRCAVSKEQLTTGVDNPMCDFIGALRPTTSPGLWVQMVGRGTRPAPGKADCLVLDFSRNTDRLGPINDPILPRKPTGRGGGGGGGATVAARICPNCRAYNHIRAVYCVSCAVALPVNVKGLQHVAGTSELVVSDQPVHEWFTVHYVNAAKHAKAGKIPSISVLYGCENFKTFKEFVNFEHPHPFVRHKAHEWWHERHHADPPETNDEALALIAQLRVPAKIKVWTNRKPYPEIVGHEY